MTEEIKRAIEDLQRTVVTFKSENDSRLEKIEKGRAVDPLLEEKVNKANSTIDSLVEKVSQIQTAMNRPAAGSKEAMDEATRAAKAAAMKWMRKGQISEAEAAQIKEALPAEYKNLSVVSDVEGGFLVRPEVSDQINTKIYETSPIRQEATVITISSDAWEEPAAYTDPAAGWVNETGSRTTTTPAQFGALRIPVFEMYAEPAISQKLLDDAAVDVETWHSGRVSQVFMRTEATAFVSGSGDGQPLGFTQYASGTGFNQVEQYNMGSSSAVTADGLIALQNKLFEDFQPNAKWFMQRQTFGAVRLLKDSQNRYLFDLETFLKDPVQLTLLGAQVRYVADMPAISGNALAVAYGDMKQAYYIIDRIGIRTLRDPYTTKGSVLFYTTKRVGGGVRNFQALKLGKIST